MFSNIHSKGVRKANQREQLGLVQYYWVHQSNWYPSLLKLDSENHPQSLWICLYLQIILARQDHQLWHTVLPTIILLKIAPFAQLNFEGMESPPGLSASLLPLSKHFPEQLPVTPHCCNDRSNSQLTIKQVEWLSFFSHFPKVIFFHSCF